MAFETRWTAVFLLSHHPQPATDCTVISFQCGNETLGFPPFLSGFVSRNQKRPGRHFYCFLETKHAQNQGSFPMFPFSTLRYSDFIQAETSSKNFPKK